MLDAAVVGVEKANEGVGVPLNEAPTKPLEQARRRCRVGAEGVRQLLLLLLLLLRDGLVVNACTPRPTSPVYLALVYSCSRNLEAFDSGSG